MTDLYHRDNVLAPSQHIGAAVISTALAVVAQDWPTGTTSSTGNRYMIVDSNVVIAFNAWSTGAAFPSTNSAGTTASSGLNIVQPSGHEHIYRIPMTSTGYSITGLTSGYVSLSFYEE